MENRKYGIRFPQRTEFMKLSLVQMIFPPKQEAMLQQLKQ